MDIGLRGKKALVTGASRGLGYATARLLAQDGAEVVINSRNLENISQAAEKLAGETGVKVFGVAGDVTDPIFPQELIAKTVELLGGLDLLGTNSAGPVTGKFEALNDDAWYQAVELSLMSHVRLIRAALPSLRKSSTPSVLTFTSYSVKQPIPYLVLSNSVRLATIGLTKTLALELGNEGIRFNSILPAWTETERIIELMIARAKINGTTPEEEIQKQSNESVFKRMSSVEEFAKAAVFLLSPAASYITGVMLTVDGGMYKGMM